MLFQTLPFFIFFAVVYGVYLLVKGHAAAAALAAGEFLRLLRVAQPAVPDPAGLCDRGGLLRRRTDREEPAQKGVAGPEHRQRSGRAGLLQVRRLRRRERQSPALVAARAVRRFPVAGLSCCRRACPSFSCNPSATRSTSIAARPTREKSFLAYATFVSFFPRLLAGPIERANHLLPQLHGERPRDAAGLHRRPLHLRRGLLQEGRSRRLPGALRRPGLRRARSSTSRPPCCWRRSCSPGRSTSTSAATRTWPAASRG